jgi:Ca-activated chloride channel family protein
MFRFENPNAFYGLIIIVLLYLFFLWAEKNLLRRKMLLGELTMIKRLSKSHFDTNENFKKYFFILGFSFLVIAAANPQWGTKSETITATKADIFIALDISNSMNAKDIAPSRLERAKKFVQSLINNQKGDRI